MCWISCIALGDVEMYEREKLTRSLQEAFRSYDASQVFECILTACVAERLPDYMIAQLRDIRNLLEDRENADAAV